MNSEQHLRTRPRVTDIGLHALINGGGGAVSIILGERQRQVSLFLAAASLRGAAQSLNEVTLPSVISCGSHSEAAEDARSRESWARILEACPRLSRSRCTPALVSQKHCAMDAAGNSLGIASMKWVALPEIMVVLGCRKQGRHRNNYWS